MNQHYGKVKYSCPLYACHYGTNSLEEWKQHRAIHLDNGILMPPLEGEQVAGEETEDDNGVEKSGPGRKLIITPDLDLSELNKDGDGDEDEETSFLKNHKQKTTTYIAAVKANSRGRGKVNLARLKKHSCNWPGCNFVCRHQSIDRINYYYSNYVISSY
jgi:hypothetical protein